MRLAVVLSVIVFALFGVVFGALNSAAVALDLYFFQFHLPLGAVVLGALACGWLLGGVVAWFGRVPRLKRQLRNTQRALRDVSAQSATAPTDDTTDGT